VEFELEAAIVGEVVVVADELDECHALCSVAEIRALSIIATPDINTQYPSGTKERVPGSQVPRLGDR
jgi:hypothetical protein